MSTLGGVNEKRKFVAEAVGSNVLLDNNPTDRLPLSMNTKKELGESLKAIREERNMTQVEVAQELKVGRRTIQNIESGDKMSVDLLLKYLKLFDYQVGYLETKKFNSSIITKTKK